MQDAHPISLWKFTPVQEEMDALEATEAVVETLKEDGRIFWKTAAGKLKCWYRRDFAESLGSLVEKKPPAWIRSPLRLEDVTKDIGDE
jgi:hypothetical protein